MGCLVKGFKSKRHCQPPTVMNLPFETDCCTVSQLIVYDLSTLLINLVHHIVTLQLNYENTSLHFL